MTPKQIKALSKEEFMKIDGASEDLYDNLQKSKSGFIRVEKISKNKGAIATGDVYEGHFVKDNADDPKGKKLSKIAKLIT